MSNHSLPSQEGLEFEDRSDYLNSDRITDWNVNNDFFQSIHTQLLGTGSRLLEGPRGTGKTHQMKIAYYQCIKNADGKPFAIFVSLNKYFHLEPLLTREINAVTIFHSWVLTKIILGACSFVEEVDKDYVVNFSEFKNDEIIITKEYLRTFISIVESPYYLESKKLDFSININVSNVIMFIERLTIDLGRKRAIILLDDAALTLTPDYFIEFLDIFRSLRACLGIIFCGSDEFVAA